MSAQHAGSPGEAPACRCVAAMIARLLAHLLGARTAEACITRFSSALASMPRESRKRVPTLAPNADPCGRAQVVPCRACAEARTRALFRLQMSSIRSSRGLSCCRRERDRHGD